mgnify:FL=1
MSECNGNGQDEIIEYRVRSINEVDENNLDVIKISKKFGESLHRCFCKMSLDEIEVFLEIVSFEENDKTWTWEKLKRLVGNIIGDKTNVRCKQCSLDEEYNEKDEIGIHHPWPKSRFGRVKEKRSIEVNISKKFENAYHHCFCNMSVPEIGIYLKEVFCTKNDKIWTWGELKALRSIIISQSNRTFNSSEVAISIYGNTANIVTSVA